MRKTFNIFGLSLAVMVFLPSFSASSRARAGFVSVGSPSSTTIQPTSGVESPPTGESVNQRPHESYEGFVFQTGVPNQVPSPTDGLPEKGKQVRVPIPAQQNNQSTSSGAGGFGHGPSGQQAGLFYTIHIPSPALFSLLRVANDVFPPPPFAVSLFRPPRIG